MPIIIIIIIIITIIVIIIIIITINIILKIANPTIYAKLANALPSFPLLTLIPFNILPRSMAPVYEGRAIANNYC